MAKTSPLADKLVTVFGGSGYVGNYVAQSLLERGARLRIASRNPEKAHTLQPLANLGQLQFARCDVTREVSVRAALHGSDYVVNLVGSFDGNLGELMGEAPGTIARLATEEGVQGMVHVSAIGADADGDTDYARAKARGEANVREAFPNATIMRPSIVFGPDDEFVNLFAGLIANFPVVPVFGYDKPIQLVFADDVAEAIATALEHPGEHGGHLYELGGPEAPTMLEIHQRIARAQGRTGRFLSVSDSSSKLFAMIPGTPMSMDQWKLLSHGNTVSGEHRTLADLGIQPRPLGLFLDKWMTRYRKFGRFGRSNERNKERIARGTPRPGSGVGAETA